MPASYIKNTLRELADKYRCGASVYRYEVADAIVNLFKEKYPYIQQCYYNYDFEDQGIFFIAWVEVGTLYAESYVWKI